MGNGTTSLAKPRRDDIEAFNEEADGPKSSTAMAIATTRAAQEVQAAMVVAKRFPRNENEAYARIMKACQRKSLAEASQYAYPRGDQTVSGPSIKLAECMAQYWGNIDFGLIELSQRQGASECMAYAWDLETNTRRSITFTVRHERHTKKGTYALEDPRDIYEMFANLGQRRVRACIMAIIPRDIQEAAVAECERTLAGPENVPLSDRVRRMASAFGSEFNVTIPMIEARLQHKLEATTEAELAQLRKVYTSIRDGFAPASDYFQAPAAEGSGAPKASGNDGLAEKLGVEKPTVPEPSTSKRRRPAGTE